MNLTDDEMNRVIKYLSKQLDKEQRGIKTLLHPLVLKSLEELDNTIDHDKKFDAISYYTVSVLLDNDFTKATKLLVINKNNIEPPIDLILTLPLRVVSLWANSSHKTQKKLYIQPIPTSIEHLIKIIKK